MRLDPLLVVRSCLFAALGVGLWSAPVADAARLSEVSRHEVRRENGEPVESAPGPRRVTAAATGDGSASQTNLFVIDNPVEAVDPLEGSQASEASILFLIEAEAGESIGDCVMVDYEFTATGSVSVSGGAVARVGVGGGAVEVATDPVAVSFEGPTQIVLEPGPDQIVQLSQGPAVIAPGDADIALADAGSFLARIGDQVAMELSSGTAWNVPPGDSATGTTEARLAAEVREGLVACPALSVVEVPTLDQWGLGGLALLLAGAGFLTLIRRRLV